MQRKTADTIALILTLVVAVITIATAFAVLYVRVAHPEQDVVPAADAIGRIIGTIIAVLAGYLAGRRINGNGSH